MAGCSGFGSSPDKEKIATFADSKQFNKKTEKFQNRIIGIIEKDQDKVFTFSTIWEWLTGVDGAEPDNKLPEEKVNIAEFMAPSDKVKFIWIGHSS